MGIIKDTSKLMFKGLFYPDNKLSLIPNWVSASRAICGLLIPLMVFFDVSFEFLLGTVFYAAVSDFLDGRLARIVAHGETPEGAMLDAISDKIFAIFLITFLIPFVNVMAVNLILEGVISVINGKILASGNETKSNFAGKIKTWPLFASLVFGYLGLSLNGSSMNAGVFMNIASGLSLVSIPLEISSAKGYLGDYTNKVNDSLTENIKSDDSDSNKDEVFKKKKHDKRFCVTLDKKIKPKAAVFECPTDEKKIEKGKEKKIDF